MSGSLINLFRTAVVWNIFALFFCEIVFAYAKYAADSTFKILCKSKLSFFMFSETWAKRFELVNEVFFFHVTNTEWRKCKKN